MIKTKMAQTGITAKRGGKRKFHIMSCMVFDDENVEISLSDKTAKYPAVLSEFPKVKDTTSIPRGLLLNRYSRRAG